MRAPREPGEAPLPSCYASGVELATRPVRFPGGSGHELAGTLETPERPRAGAVVVPCFTCTRDAKAVVRISRALAAAGIAALRFDPTGIGGSGGAFEATTVRSQVGDVRAAAAFLEAGTVPVRLLVGVSLGGALAVLAAEGLPGVRAVATVNAPAGTAHLRELLLEIEPRLAHEDAEVTLLGRTTRIGRAFVEDLARHDVASALGRLGRPLLVAHAVEDRLVPLEAAATLFAAARHPRSFVAVDGVGHLMLEDPDAAAWLGEVIAAWARRYLT